MEDIFKKKVICGFFFDQYTCKYMPNKIYVFIINK